MPTSGEIRQQFIDFFVKKHDHYFAPSSPVVPHGDPTLLFANAGMNQFKPYFLGTEATPNPPRAANTQKCIRAGGKHNDLDDVGKDTYHHTFFEMLGNWSFGDYFKAEAIAWAWELLVEVWGIDPQRLHATYFEGDEAEGLAPDTEARELWLRYLPAERIHPGNKKDNFWEMGDTGPCGPCSEIHYDRTPDKSGGTLVNADGQDSVVEVWNLVFIQFNRGTDGRLTPLPAKHVDTGMGFERIVRVLQSKTSNYDTDVFTPLFGAIHKVTGARPYDGGEGTLSDPIDTAYRVIADHIRCLTFALSDGAHCGNNGRESVLRTILRRAVRYGHQQLGVERPFFYKLVPAVVEQMGDFFPELKKNPQAVADELLVEEESFRKTLARGITIFDREARHAISKHFSGRLTGGHGGYALLCTPVRRRIHGSTQSLPVNQYDADDLAIISHNGTKIWEGKLGDIPSDLLSHAANGQVVLDGETAFDLEATYGFPISLTQVMAQERGLTVDMAGYEKAKQKHSEVSRADTGTADATAQLIEFVQNHKPKATEFVGYTATELSREMSLQVFPLGHDRYAVVTDATPFYAESGGQVGDTGIIQVAGGARFTIDDTQKVGDVVFHLGKLNSGEVKPCTGKVGMAVDPARRALIMSNHTTTHVMNRALRDLVNAQTMQKGSLVDPERLRFDFSNNGPVEAEQLAAVEEQVRADIAADLPVYIEYAPQEAALQVRGLRAVFGEKYPPKVRVVSIGAPVDALLAEPDSDKWEKLSIEFCGGTHLRSTGQAGGFCIVSEEGVAKGVRRITALTGQAAHDAQTAGEELLNRVTVLAQAKTDDELMLSDEVAAITTALGERTMSAVTRQRVRAGLAEVQAKLKEALKQRSKESAGLAVDAARKRADAMSGPVIVASIGEVDASAIRTAMDVFRKKHADSAVLLAGTSDGKVALMATVPKPMIDRGLKAGDWIKHVAPVVGGGGGGRPDSAQAGGKDPGKIEEALKAAETFAGDKLK